MIGSQNDQELVYLSFLLIGESLFDLLGDLERLYLGDLDLLLVSFLLGDDLYRSRDLDLLFDLLLDLKIQNYDHLSLKICYPKFNSYQCTEIEHGIEHK